VIEPSSGRTTTSGPGAPLLIGLVAVGALLVAFLAGYQLGSGSQRVETVVIGASAEPSAAGPDSSPTAAAGGRPLVQPPRVDETLQQAYYANLQLGAWLVCVHGSALDCVQAPYREVNPDRAFDRPAARWQRVPHASVAAGPIYLAISVERAWIGPLADNAAGTYRRVLGVTLNESVQYIDLGTLPAGRYVLLGTSADRRLAFATGLEVTR
jgi:hypothetical protein